MARTGAEAEPRLEGTGGLRYAHDVAWKDRILGRLGLGSATGSPQPLSAKHVRWAYRILLDREPESGEAVARHLSGSHTTQDLRNAIFVSPEFRANNPLHPGYTPESTVVLAELDGGLRVFIDLSDSRIGLNVARGRYDVWETAFVRRTIQPGDAVLDIGANIGFFSVLMASLAGPDGRVVAFEPVPRNLQLLEKTIAENDFGGRISVVPAAVGEAPGQARLIHLPLEAGAANSGGSYLHRDAAAPPAEHQVLDAPQIELDTFDLPRPVRFIKIDVEGAEPLAFRGARKLLRTDRPTILCEINPMQLERVAHTTANEFLADMSALGYTCSRLREDSLGPPLRRLGGDLINVVFQPTAGAPQ